jgi:hypothetical protein
MLNAVKISAAVRKKREKILTRIKINKFYLGGDLEDLCILCIKPH